jgi:hypothetical protein
MFLLEFILSSGMLSSAFSALSSPFLPATTRHRKTFFAKRTSLICGQDFFNIATNPGSDLNPTFDEAGLQHSRNAGTNQHFDADLCQLSGSFLNGGFLHRMLFASIFAVIGQIDQQQLPGNIEDGGNAALPDWNGDFHAFA